MSVRKLIDKSNDMNRFERLQHPAPSRWMSPKQGNIRSNLPRKKYIKHTNPNTRADEISKKKEHRHHTWLHSDTEFPSGSRALAFSKILSNLSKLVPGLFQIFFKIRPDCYQASPTIARGPSTKCFKFQNFSDLFSIFVATCYLKSTSWIGLPPPIPCTFWSGP